jgi:hypothetical protein
MMPRARAPLVGMFAQCRRRSSARTSRMRVQALIVAASVTIQVFQYTASHNVWRLQPGQTTCPSNFQQVATEVGATNRGGGTAPLTNKLKVSLGSPGTYTFACEIGSHCAAGQVRHAYRGPVAHLCGCGVDGACRLYPYMVPCCTCLLLLWLLLVARAPQIVTVTVGSYAQSQLRSAAPTRVSKASALLELAVPVATIVSLAQLW